MAVDVRTNNNQWVRKLDGATHIVNEQASCRLYPSSLIEADECVQRAIRKEVKEARAVGSHWGYHIRQLQRGSIVQRALNRNTRPFNRPRLQASAGDGTSECSEFRIAKSSIECRSSSD